MRESQEGETQVLNSSDKISTLLLLERMGDALEITGLPPVSPTTVVFIHSSVNYRAFIDKR